MRTDNQGQTLTSEPLAHLDEQARPHLLQDHLRDVGELARGFAERFGAGEWGRLAGRWHDLGKYSRHFQRIIREENGFEAHVEKGEEKGPRDHSTAGALHARQVLGKRLGSLLTFAIAGHHAGLANRGRLEERLEKKKELLQDALAAHPPADLLQAAAPGLPDFLASPARTPSESDRNARSLELWIRMLFSALCDADFLDTENFLAPERALLREKGPSLESLRDRLSLHLEGLRTRAAATEVNRVRGEVLASCREAASLAPGVFSLTTFKVSRAIALAMARKQVGGRRKCLFRGAGAALQCIYPSYSCRND